MLRYSTIIIILIKFQTAIQHDKINYLSLIKFSRVLSLSYLIPPDELEISKKRYSYETHAAVE